MQKNRIHFCAFFVVILTATATASAQTVTPSDITAVTLFSNQALVTRKASFEADKGLNEILLTVDAFRLDADSVTAKVFGKGELYSVQLKDVFLPEAPQEKIKALEDKLRALRKSRRAVEDAKAVLKTKEKFLASVVDFSKTQVPQDMKTSFPKPQALGDTLVFLAKQSENIFKQRQDLDDKAEKLDAEIAAAQKELSALSDQRPRQRKVIEVLFKASTAQKISIEAGYIVYNAYWQPLYKAAVPADLTAVDLTMFAKIQQKTGEDWNGVSLSVSNVTPLHGAGLPEPAPWILDVVRPVPATRSRMMKGNAKMMELAAEPPMEEAEEDRQAAGFVSAQVKESALSFEYQLPGKLVIASQDKTTLLPIFTKTLSGEFLHRAVPQTSPMVFLICRATADKELLSGPMNVHLGANFIGKTYLKAQEAGEHFDLNLGVDRDVKIKQEKIKDAVKETLFGTFERSTIVRELAYKITVENLKTKPVTLMVLGSLPVSRTDKIKVEDVSLDPAPSQKNYQDKSGVLLWNLSLAPREKKDIRTAFVLNYPKDVPVSGLP